MQQLCKKLFNSDITEISPTRQMIEMAKHLKTGEIIFCYKDHGTIRMETEDGENPYVWRDGQWREMRL